MGNLIRGDQLNTDQRRQVLAAYVHRHTEENARQTYGGKCPNCEQSARADGLIITGSKRGPIPITVWTKAEWHAYHTSKGAKLQTDAAWLADHAFWFTKDGTRLHGGHHRAEPAWLVAQRA
jgi:hypothetical protein